MSVQRERRQRKTWSLFGDVRRVPSEYEVVTGQLHYHYRKSPAPFEQDPGTPINRWYLQYREGSPLHVDDWEAFREPSSLTYRRYIEQQNHAETYVDGLIDRFEEADHDASLSQEWVETLERAYLPSRYSGHVLQMTALYVGQLAPSSFVTNPAHLQAADEMRRIQRLAYRAKSLSLAHWPELASSARTRSIWEDDAAWQPMREACERLLVAYDWGEAFAALNLAVKPAHDALLTVELARVAGERGDGLTQLVLESLAADCARSREWTAALVGFAVEQRPENAAVLAEWLAVWQPRAEAAIEALGADVPGVDAALASYRGHLAACGLGG